MNTSQNFTFPSIPLQLMAYIGMFNDVIEHIVLEIQQEAEQTVNEAVIQQQTHLSKQLSPDDIARLGEMERLMVSAEFTAIKNAYLAGLVQGVALASHFPPVDFGRVAKGQSQKETDQFCE